MDAGRAGLGAGPRAGLIVDAEVSRGSFTLRVAFTAAPGQVLGVLGPNGAGKSTLLHALAGLTPVARGRIELAGQVIDDASAGTFVEAAGRPVGFVFQDYRLFPHLTVAQNVAFGPRARGAGRQQARSVAGHWLGRLGLDALADRKPGQLSGGQAQRVALARALAGEPALLLLDEPLSALDAGTRLDVQAELRRHLADFPGPCLLVTHDPLEALVLADQLLVLEDGRIVQEGPPAQVARQPATQYVARLVGLNLYEGVADDSGVSLSGGGRLGGGSARRAWPRPARRRAGRRAARRDRGEQRGAARGRLRHGLAGQGDRPDPARRAGPAQPRRPAARPGRRHARRGGRAVAQPRLPGVADGPAGRPRGLSPPGQRGSAAC